MVPQSWKLPSRTLFQALKRNVAVPALAQPAMSTLRMPGWKRSAIRNRWKKICWILPMMCARPAAFPARSEFRQILMGLLSPFLSARGDKATKMMHAAWRSFWNRTIFTQPATKQNAHVRTV
ncbi:UNVERIFIED_CONTAM: hypothetical protein GTU68_051337 [Idotea baltica]|nr:hypothetical protein [Idotea baltica]